MTNSVQETAEAHAALGSALDKALKSIEGGGPIPWADLEAAVEIAIKHALAEVDDLRPIKERALPVERLKDLLRQIRDRYGANQKCKSKI
ncbi:hypothetical protein [Pseudoxanthomonas sp. 3HH-4]|uniref:hypothetical protein n=1 Tax=Pseudoxanthomonas sp. 3HH-4 TaxID=1690214 RepID=UPI001152687A|nr:hypothetical protein [Pseudoxanthomonas sp. 3HH-4]